MTEIEIPDELVFTDLQLVLNHNGEVTFNMDVIEQICEASDLPKDYFWVSHRDQLVRLICDWYEMHREEGGEPDPVAEDLYSEAKAMADAGQPVCYGPGRA
ncbi:MULTISPECIES: hypothetical protein [unclassified Aeromonas]|jgi:hypothetical protein|uniref:hypothetical protein n=1 Tax=unclassified Aeromonas TaxID=257493 RepID=UPI0022E5796E|nr:MULTISPECIES: hypothetical protein [unclassified Aeromonas]